ncbi:MAG TPA: AI-2E family transporter [Cytophagales bacterium]|jgi:predicted PurR-regulated permease PerM
MRGISIHRANAMLLFAILLTVALYYAHTVLVPLTFGIILAMLLLPACRKLESWGLGRALSVFGCILLLLLGLAAVLGVIYIQAANFAEEGPRIQKQFQQSLQEVQQWIGQQLGVSPQKQINLIQQGAQSLSKSGQSFAKKFASGLAGGLTDFVLVLVYIFFFLWKRERFAEFFLQLASDGARPEARQTLRDITKVSARYMGGRLLAMTILATLYAVGFMIVGLKNGILLAVIAVLPTIVPFVGPLFGGLFPLAAAMVDSSSGLMLPVLGVLVAGQLIDEYFIEPFVLGSNLDLSPLMTIFSIVVGEALWGISGMILFIPLFAIAKITFDHVPSLHPLAFLLGDEGEEGPGFVTKIKKWFGK